MPNLSTAIVMKALDGLYARATVSAENIANANTPGYRPLHVSFEDALARAAVHGREAVDALQPQIQREAASGPGLRLDLELATTSQTGMRYAALIEVLNHRLQRDASALSGNL
jgi:flagellar basal-body rod protein FlgB